MAQPCKECGVRPKDGRRSRCAICALRHAPIDEQVAECRRRLAMIPEDMRVKWSKKIEALAPTGTSWCAACQSFRDVIDFGKGATRCRACVSAATHGAMVEKTYGLTAIEYDRLARIQDGKCAICRARPISKRLAVDHDHKTGAVRGLLCSRCNHDLMGAAWDSSAMALALWWYIHEPPTSGHWRPPESGLESPSRASEAPGLPMVTVGQKARESVSSPVPMPSLAEVRKLSVVEATRVMLELVEKSGPPPF